jgi:N-6 DNA Methylase
MLDKFVHRIVQITRESKSETALQVGLEPLLAELLTAHGVTYKPSVNETLKSLGLSQVDSTRPDSLFGHVVLDYKAPRLLDSSKELTKARQQVEGYLNSAGDNPDKPEALLWSGILWDGASLCFCHSDGQNWVWTNLLPVSEPVLQTLVSTYRALHRKPLTASLLADAFGKDSEAARHLLSTMCSHLSKPRHRTTMLFREWKRLFEQVSTYGLDQLPALKSWARSLGIATKDASQILFAIHSHYALVVKLLTSELLAAVSPTEGTSVCERIAHASSIEQIYKYLSDLEDGEHWRKYRISNFLEGDFFSWYTNERSKALAQAIQLVAREFLQFEPATALLRPESKKDLLKEFYTTLVDEQIRHDLGEYYTPDWLAQRILDRVEYSGDPDVSVLDPACGSGTFLVECISRIRRKTHLNGPELLNRIVKHVRGMELNPLAVISARANYILSIADLVFSLGEDVELPIYLADCINVPVEKTATDGLEVFGFRLDTELGSYEFEIPTTLVRHQILGKVLLACEDAIKQKRTAKSFLQSVRALPDVEPLLEEKVEKRLVGLFDIVAKLEEREWNRIWCRIVKNNFSPNGFGKIDVLVGNPPWVRWSRLPQTYRSRVKQFCNYYGLVSGKGYTGGIETDISTVVLYSAADHWLKDEGKVGILITWTVFKSASARGFRLGVLPNNKGLRIREIASPIKIQPFPDATNETSIYVGEKVKSGKSAVFDKTHYEEWKPSGVVRIDPRAELSDVLASVKLDVGVASPVSDWGSPLWTGSAKAFKEASIMRGRSAYLESAHRGTISDLARLYWVKVEKYSAATDRALIRTLTPAELTKAAKIDPVEGAWIEAELLHPLVRGRDAGRYATRTDGWYQIIPNRHYEEVESEEDFAEKYPCAYSYFSNYRDLLVKRSTYRRYQKHLPFYVIYCVGAYSFARWKVVWMEQQEPKSFRCAVISDFSDSLLPNKRAIPDHKLYLADFASKEEAHFVCAYLNSRVVRTWLGGFLHGKQIGTSIFEYMKTPTYNSEDKDHQRLSEISVEAHRERKKTRDSALLTTALENELADIVRRVAG